ncbi:hypothetical protein F5B19DRAFT_494049 [Rostrohypoxylon terebratum]|nr:hypothetical protein F5B19DRAFT_494049 [Rostrohypoxylon terebratum]
MTQCLAARPCEIVFTAPKLLDAGIMTKAEFCKAIGCSSVNTLNAFLRQTGPNGGSSSSAYYNAWAWFRQREVANLKMPDVKKRQSQEAGAAGSAARGPASKAAAAGVTSLPDISNIVLPGEEVDDVSVWDTCDEVRKKINAHLRTTGMSQAQFCREIFAQLHQPKIKSIQSKQLNDFLKGKGPRTGAKSTVFYSYALRLGSPSLNSARIWRTSGPVWVDLIVPAIIELLSSARTSLHFDRYDRIF